MDNMPREYFEQLKQLVDELQKLSEIGILVVAVTSFQEEGEKIGSTIITNVKPAQAMAMLEEAIGAAGVPSRKWSDVGKDGLQ